MSDDMTVVSVPDDALFKLLKEHCSEVFVSELWNLLQPYYAMLETEVYGLKPQAELDEAAIAAAIQMVLDLPETPKLAFLSQSEPFPKRDWMTDEAYDDGLWRVFRDSCNSFFVDNLIESLEDDYEEDLEDELASTLHECMDDCLADKIEEVVSGSLNHIFDAGLQFEDSHWQSLLYTLGFALAGRTEYVERLAGLLRVQAHCLVIGQKKDDPDVWIVLCQ